MVILSSARTRRSLASRTAPGSTCYSRRAWASASSSTRVSEPLYYYRQPRSWSGSAPGSDICKPGYDDDDQKANQAIFITLYHWGLHGWILHLVPTVLLGLVSHRWGLPMTVRPPYPLINHIFSTLGDIIDALSIACTTFGVCTSLVLGAGQVCLCNRIYLGPRRFASDAGLEAGSGQSGGGKWPPSFCPFPEGGDEEAGIAPTDCGLQTFQQLVIWSITAVATASVILGLDAGLKAISFIAMSLAMLCFMLPLVSDNTWFMLNTFVQQVGYYFQNLIQVGFDCEAFQQLGVEFRLGSNHLWGQSKGAFNLMDRLKDSGVNNGSYVSTTGPDCGAEKNPCFVGSIAPAIAAMSSAYLTSAGLSAADAMKAFALSTATRTRRPYHAAPASRTTRRTWTRPPPRWACRSASRCLAACRATRSRTARPPRTPPGLVGRAPVRARATRRRRTSSQATPTL